MADPLSLLRQYHMRKKEIVERDGMICFGEYCWPKQTKTNYLIYSSSSDGSNKNYYTLECLVYFLHNVHLQHPTYVKQAASFEIPVVQRPDRKNLLAYLSGETSTSVSIDMNISDEEIRRRLINDHNVQCGPITTQTRRILLKMLIKLENERMSINNSNETNGTFNGSMNDDQHEYSDIMNGDNHHRNDHVRDVSNIRDEDISSIETIRPTIEIRRSTTRKQSHGRNSPQRQIISDEEIEAIEKFKEVQKTLKQPSLNKKSTKSFGVLHSTNSSLNDLFSEISDDNDDTNEMVKPALNTPNSYKISGITMPRVTENQTYRPISSLSRAPIRRSTVTTKPTLFNIHKSNTSLLNYSDSESDTEQSYEKDKLCQVLLNHHPLLRRARHTANKRSFTWVFTSFFQNMKRKLWPSQKKNVTANFSSWALLMFVIIFFVVIFSIYFWLKFTHTSRYNLTDYAFIEDKSELLAPVNYL